MGLTFRKWELYFQQPMVLPLGNGNCITNSLWIWPSRTGTTDYGSCIQKMGSVPPTANGSYLQKIGTVSIKAYGSDHQEMGTVSITAYGSDP